MHLIILRQQDRDIYLSSCVDMSKWWFIDIKHLSESDLAKGNRY